MRFDPARLESAVQLFAFPRAPRSDDLHRAEEILAGELRQAGLEVHREEQAGSRFQLLLVAVAYLLYCLLVTWLIFPAGRSWRNLAHGGRGLALVLLATWLPALFVVLELFLGRHLARRKPARLLATRSRMAAPAARVVFATYGATPPPRWLIRRKVVVGVLAELMVLALVVGGLVLHLGPARAAQHSRLIAKLAGFLALVGLGPISQSLRWAWTDVAAPRNSDNRTGLALLLELARCWNREALPTLEVQFLLSEGRPAQTAALLRHRSKARSPRPTLVIVLDAPGLGPLLWVRTHWREPVRSLALSVAQDLHIPHRAEFAAGDGIRLASERGRDEINPALLMAALQFATETALRWDRMHRLQGPAGGESAARSSQKPG